MPRILIDLPAELPFFTDIQVYGSHINIAGHVDNALMLTLVSETRQRFLKHLAYRETDVEGVGIIVADAAIQYLSEAFQGDVLRFVMTAHEFNKYGCDLVYQAHELSSGREVVRGKTGIVFFDYAARRITTVPPAFRDKIALLAAPSAR